VVLAPRRSWGRILRAAFPFRHDISDARNGPNNVPEIIRRVEETAYELERSATMRMHDVFHVSLLKPYNAEKHTVVPMPPTLTVGGQREFEVQQILAHKEKQIKHAKKGRPTVLREYLVS